MACEKDAERVESLLSSLELVLQAWDRQISSSRKGLEALKGAPAAEAAAEAALSDALAASKAIEVHLAAVRGERLLSVAVSGTACESASHLAGGDRPGVHSGPANVSEKPEPAKDAAFDVNPLQTELPKSRSAAAKAFQAAQVAKRRPELCDQLEEGLDSASSAPKVCEGDAGIDFSMFNKDVWERARRRGEAMLSESQAGAFSCYKETLPKALKVPQSGQAKIRRLQVSTEEKILRCYQEMAAGSGMGRGGFLLSADLDRFIVLIQENSEAPDAKRGGDIGWIGKGKVEPRLEAVALTTPRGACSPAFLERPGCFQMVYVEERR